MKLAFLPLHSTAVYYGWMEIGFSQTPTTHNTTMFKHSAKQIQSYSQLDVEIRKKSQLLF